MSAKPFGGISALCTSVIMRMSQSKSCENRQGPAGIPIAARNRQMLPRDPQAISNPGPQERPILAELQHINSQTEIVNPRPQGQHKRVTIREDNDHQRLKKRRTTTQEERLEALTFLENGREWKENKAGRHSSTLLHSL